MRHDIPAFPLKDSTLDVQYRGMTLKQWYQGLAMQGLLSNPAITDSLDLIPAQIAAIAGDIADAMEEEG